MKRIGILGGSFDPIHFGHLLMAQSAAEALKLDAVFFVPAFRSPFKSSPPPNASKRLVMVKEAIKGNKVFKLYDGELRRGHVSYTIDTLKELLKRDIKLSFPGTQLEKEFANFLKEDGGRGTCLAGFYRKVSAPLCEGI